MKKFSILYLMMVLFCWVSLPANAVENGTNQQIPATNSVVMPPLSTGAESSSQEISVGSGVIFQPRVWTGAMNLKHDVLSTTTRTAPDGKQTTSFGRINFESTMPILGVGATLVYKRFFLDGYVQKTSTGEDKTTDVVSTTNKLTETTDIDYEIEREDYSASLGYKVTDGLVIFGGYRSGQTSYDSTAAFFYATDSIPKTLYDKRSASYEFKAQGPFVGLSYSYPVSERGQLGFNVGYAQLDGEYTQTATDKASNSTSGLTYGINWRGKLYKNLSYGLSLDKYDYEFSELKYSSELPPDGVANHTLSAKDEIFTFKFTLSYAF